VPSAPTVPKCNHMLASLHDDARFKGFLRKMKLPEGKDGA
jgi:hypothetical protein